MGENARRWRASPHPGPSGPARIPGTDGFRAVAAGSILVYHCWRYAAPSAVSFGPLDHILRQLPLGVTLFFTLSGFLLYRPFADAVSERRPWPKLSSYFRNRALRILPAYWVILFFSASVLGTTLVRHSPISTSTGSLLTRPELLARNALFVQNYDPRTFLTGIGPAWSLAIEVAFYCSLPIVCLAAFALARRSASSRTRRLAVFVPPFTMLAIGLTGKATATFLVPDTASGVWIGNWHSVLLHAFFGQADLFAYGMTLAVLYSAIEHGAVRLPAWWRRATCAGLIAICFPAVWLVEDGHLSQDVYDDVMALAAALLLALVVLPEGRRSSWLRRTLETRALVAAGLVSYSVFLWHEPLVRWLNARGATLGGRPGFFVNLILLVALTGGCAALTYRFVERPALDHKRRAPAPVEPALPAALLRTPDLAKRPS